MALTLRPTKFLNEAALLSSAPENAIRFEVDGLPTPLYAQIVRAPDGRWRAQWAKRGERFESLSLIATPDEALTALETLLRNRGYSV